MRSKYGHFFIIFILLFIYWQWLLPGPRVATDFSLISQESLKSFLDLPRTWSTGGTEGLGEYTVFTLWSWPVNLLYGILANLGFSFVLLERILITLPFLLIGTYGIWKLCESLNLSIYARVISSIFYLSNTYILLLLDGGQLSISLAFALFPAGFLAVERAINGTLKKKILAGLLLFVIGFFDIRFLYILFLLCLIKFIYDFFYTDGKKRRAFIVDWCKTGFVITFIILGLNAYWLLAFFKFPLSSNFYAYLTQTSFTSFISIGHAIFLLSPHWFKNVFGNVIPLKFEFILIPIFVFLAPILRPKNKVVGFWLVVAVASIFLAKGASDPLPGVYQWLYYNVPGFSLFRDSSKFFFLVSLSYTVLIGITADEIVKRSSSLKIKVGFVAFVVGYLVIIINPVWLGLMTGTFSTPPLQKEYSKLNSLISEDKIPSNVFWIPTISPLTKLNLLHPAVEANRLAQKRPFAQANLGTYELFNYLREAPYMGQLFDIAGIGYIVYPYLDQRRDNLHPDNIRYYYTFLGQLSKLPWFLRVNNSPIPLFKVREIQDKFFITPNVWWVIGSDSIYRETTKSSKLSLSKNALIFPEETTDLGTRIDEAPDSKIVLYHKHLLDLAVSFIGNDELIFPAKKLNRDPGSSGWWKRETSDLIDWRYFLKTKYGIDNQDFDLGNGWAVGENSLKLEVKSEKFKKDKVLLARVMESSRSGKLKFYQDSQEIGEIPTKISGDTNVRWFEVGRLRSDSQALSVRSEGDINVVNALAVLSDADLSKYRQKAKDYQDQGRIINFSEKNTQEQERKITYQQINPTKYSVRISGLIKPAFLVFSQNFNPLWKLNNNAAFPVYSLLNGFWIKQDGEYIVEFEAQEFVYPGLIITGLTAVVIVFLLIQSSKRSDLKL